ncbi:hypothetical protein J6590_080431 [Homalodisca vitripennis]|nr:hypothetical protein J6590_080431 [Homalodisca vitripennis]
MSCFAAYFVSMKSTVLLFEPRADKTMLGNSSIAHRLWEFWIPIEFLAPKRAISIPPSDLYEFPASGISLNLAKTELTSSWSFRILNFCFF